MRKIFKHPTRQTLILTYLMRTPSIQPNLITFPFLVSTSSSSFTLSSTFGNKKMKMGRQRHRSDSGLASPQSPTAEDHRQGFFKNTRVKKVVSKWKSLLFLFVNGILPAIDVLTDVFTFVELLDSNNPKWAATTLYCQGFHVPRGSFPRESQPGQPGRPIPALSISVAFDFHHPGALSFDAGQFQSQAYCNH